MTALAHRPALILNADYRPLSHSPLSVVTWQEAVRAVFLDRAYVIETYSDTVRSPTFEMKLPAVIVLRAYRRAPRLAPFTRRNVYLRDEFQCVYCAEPEDLTLDHVIPKSRGHRHNWVNTVTACAACNQKKGNRTPAEAGMTLRRAPYQPTSEELHQKGKKRTLDEIADSWRPYVG